MITFYDEEDVLRLATDRLDLMQPNPDRLHDIAERMGLEYDEESGLYFENEEL